MVKQKGKSYLAVSVSPNDATLIPNPSSDYYIQYRVSVPGQAALKFNRHQMPEGQRMIGYRVYVTTTVADSTRLLAALIWRMPTFPSPQFCLFLRLA